MKFVGLLFLLIAAASCALLLVGLWRPWVVLWWEHTQNRKKVIQLYGLVIVISLAIYVALDWFVPVT